MQRSAMKPQRLSTATRRCLSQRVSRVVTVIKDIIRADPENEFLARNDNLCIRHRGFLPKSR